MAHPVAAREALSALSAGITLSLGDPALRRRIMLSVVVNGLVFGLVLAGALWGASEAVAWAFAGQEAADPAWYETVWYSVKDGLRWLLYAAFVVGALLYSPVLFSLLAGVLLPAFFGPVFTAARGHAGGPAVDAAGLPFATTVAGDLKRLFRFLLYSFLLLPLNLIPGVGNLIYLVAQFLLSARAMGWDLLAHHFELHGMDLAEQRRWIRAHRGLVLTLGSGATLLAMVPLAQILFITTNVAGAGILSAWLDGAPRDT